MNIAKALSLALFFFLTAAFACGGESVCPLHKEPMTAVEVPIRYGYPVLDATYEQARSKAFPCANEGYTLGGCVIMADSPKTGTVFVCAQCDATRGRYLAEHGGDERKSPK